MTLVLGAIITLSPIVTSPIIYLCPDPIKTLSQYEGAKQRLHICDQLIHLDTEYNYLQYGLMG
jgi:hypothetical protein